MAANRKPENTVLDYVLKLRLNSGLKAVMQQCAEQSGHTTISEWVRAWIQTECDKAIRSPGKRPLVDDLNF